MSDDLLQPSIGKMVSAPRKMPWRVQSQLWVAFFGGIAAVTTIAILNARRLGLDRRKQWLMAGAGAVALGVLLALWLRQPPAPTFIDFARGSRELRLIGRVIAVVLFLLHALLQKPADAHYRVFAKGDYASLWGPGIAATFLIGSLQSLLIIGLAWWVRS